MKNIKRYKLLGGGEIAINQEMIIAVKKSEDKDKKNIHTIIITIGGTYKVAGDFETVLKDFSS